MESWLVPLKSRSTRILGSEPSDNFDLKGKAMLLLNAGIV